MDHVVQLPVNFQPQFECDMTSTVKFSSFTNVVNLEPCNDSISLFSHLKVPPNLCFYSVLCM